MKKFMIIAVLLLLACVGIHAQGLTLSLDITAGGLKDAMTAEQKKIVTSLTLTGSMNDSDFYLIRDSMPELSFLDIKSVEVDTIPARAFYGSCCECILPVTLKYIDDEAFLNNRFQTIVITGPFPKLGFRVIEKDIDRPVFSVSSDNIYCSQKYDNIYSADGKIFYFQQGNETFLGDGVEIIESRAFDGSSIRKDYSVTFSSELKLIKEYAFSNLTLIRGAFRYVELVCLAPTPPVLEEHAFDDERLFESTLYVPNESVDLYKQSDSQWSKFRIITGINVQDLTLSLDITTGSLKDALTLEQKKTLTNLTLTGSMNDSDFYLIRDSMPNLKTLDIKSVEVDTIPARAFYRSGCKECILPVSLKYIGDEAFLNSSLRTILLTGPFPKLGSLVIERNMELLKGFIVSPDNLYCIQDVCNIFSLDESVFYLQQGYDRTLPPGVEIIESRAFDNIVYPTNGYGITLPSELKLIKENAFSNIRFELSFELLDIVCDAAIPPILEEHAFADERLFEGTLYVPEGSVDLYKQSDSQWSKFREIKELIAITIKNNPEQFITTTKVENGWQINTEKPIQSVRITDSSGVPCSFSMPDDRHIFLSSDKNNRQLYFVKIVFEDGTVDSLKLLN